MILESALWVTSILFFICGFAVAFARGVRGRAYIFIFTLTTVFLMLGVFASDVVWKYAKPADYDNLKYPQKDQVEEQTKGTAIFIIGLIGLILLALMRGIKTSELGYVFGIGGSIQLVSGLIAMVAGEAVELKFFVTLLALLILSYLFYRYRDFLMGK